MTDYEALVLACLYDPDDEGPRLVLADFLDEKGTPHLLRYPGHWRLLCVGKPGHSRQKLAWNLGGLTEDAYSQTVLGLLGLPTASLINCAGEHRWPGTHAEVRHDGRWLCLTCAAPAMEGRPEDYIDPVDRRASMASMLRAAVSLGALTINEVRALERGHPIDARAAEARHHPLR